MIVYLFSCLFISLIDIKPHFVFFRFAGLDSLSLCNTRCVWTKSIDINLEMFDAGTHEPTWDNPSIFDVSLRYVPFSWFADFCPFEILFAFSRSWKICKLSKFCKTNKKLWISLPDEQDLYRFSKVS